jgi:hypothetical protein
MDFDICGIIPHNLCEPGTSFFPNFSHPHPPVIYLKGDLSNSYYDTLSALRRVRELEYLKDPELEDIFWGLTCWIILNRDKLRKNLLDSKSIAEQFVSRYIKNLDTYNVLVPIENLDLKGEKVKIGEVYVKKFDKIELGEYAWDEGAKGFIDKLAGKTFALVTEHGNNFDLVCRRAKEQAAFTVRVLQVSLKTDMRIKDQYAYLTIGDSVIVKKIGTPLNQGGRQTDRSDKPRCLEINKERGDKIREFITSISAILEEDKISEPLRKIFSRAIIWIGQSIDDKDYDMKIIKLSIALESILTTRDDRLKGEALAYRLMILYSIQGKNFADLRNILHIYEIRSDIVHKGEKDVSSDVEYCTMRDVATEALLQTLSIILEQKINDINGFKNFLESHEERAVVDRWLEKQTDKNSDKIKKWVKNNFSEDIIKATD